MSILANFKQALKSVRSARWRSLFTMTGVIIGVASVITVVSIGEGVKKQVLSQVSQLGGDLIVVLPGPDSSSHPTFFTSDATTLPATPISNLSSKDLISISKSQVADTALPLTMLSGVVASDQSTAKNSLIIVTSSAAPTVFNQKIEYGTFFRDLDEDKHMVVIGSALAESLFKDPSPLGSKLQFRGQDFTVRGVFEKFDNSPLADGVDLNSGVFLHPLALSPSSENNLPISQILIKPKPGLSQESAIQTLTEALKQSHGGANDFRVQSYAQLANQASHQANLLTSLIAGIAAISLFVGGVGIMNTMLLAVIERTHEIGIRKAIGASNGQILAQFLSEACVLSVWGGILGLALAGLANYLLRVLTDYKPIINLPIVAWAVGIPVLMGVVFGIIPALKAARKNPIDALRYS